MGVINLQFDDGAPLPLKMTEAQTYAHMLGVVLVQQYGLNKRVELFSEKADADVLKELKQIHELETYEPILSSDKEALESLLFFTEKKRGYKGE